MTLRDIQSHFKPEERRKIDDARRRALESRDEVTFEASVNHDDGTVINLQSHVKAVRLSNGENVVIYSSVDITSRKRLEANLLVLSETDSLTQISNRRSGEQRVSRLVMDGRGGMFCLFDANKFKFVNDNFGHAAGDKVLVEIAACMKKAFRANDVLVRLGGDEFVVFAPGVEDREVGRLVLDRFMQRISGIDIPELNGHRISVSLGAVITQGREEFSKLYTKADSLMYDCKKQGGNAYKFYGSE
jgi:diguanylate cyclase (GGDEF)-like protein